MKKSIFPFCLVLLGLVGVLSAQSSWVGIGQSHPQPADITLINSNIQTTQIQFSVDGFLSTDIRTPQGIQQLISLENGVQIIEKGAPDLAKLYTSIIIPDTEEMEVRVVRSSYEDFENIEVLPSKGHFTRDINPDDVPYTYSEVYQNDAFWPGILAQLEDPFIIRDFRGQTVTIFPFQYNPVTKTLRVYTDIVVEVTSTGRPGENILARSKDLSQLESEFRQIYNHMFLNMEYYETGKYIIDEEGSMLIIVFDDFAEAMQPFVNWKRTIGRKTEMVLKSEAGSTAAAIKTFVQNYYTENEDFTYLLLVGDAPQIPANSTSNGASDNAYGYLVGTDSYNEIFVGRFSAENIGNVETQVERMIHYERDINETDTWLNTGMGVARNEGAGQGHNGEADYQHMDLIRDTLLNFTYDVVYREYDGNVPGVTNTTAAQISAGINNGVSIINYINHGSIDGWSVANYNIAHVNQLTNINKLPFIWSVACVNGSFVSNFCFAEAWMRATHEGQPTGAIGTLMSTINQAWTPPMTGQDEMVTIMAEKRDHIKRTYGGLSINGSMIMIASHGSSGIETHDTWNLFGDPSLQVRTDVPIPIMATYNPVILIGLSEFEISVENADGATVALSRYNEIDDVIEIIGTAVVENGTATVTFAEPLTEPGTLTLAVTGFNKVTLIDEEIQVIPPDGPYVIFNQLLVEDELWNDNNQADYGETLNLNVALKNVGIDPAQEVQATLTTESPYVTILQDEQAYGLIEEDGIEMVEGAFMVKIAQVIPDNHSVLFTLNIIDAEENTWSSNFIMRIYSPMFTIGELAVADGEGDGNNRLDPGETADLVVRYTNNGGAPAMSPIALFLAENPYFTVHEYETELPVIPAGEFLDVPYTVTAHQAVVEGTMLPVLFSIEDGHLFESQQDLIIGQVPETTLGTGNATSAQYPFYNYYKANRSQMIYLSSEMGEGEKTILELGFNIVQVANQYNNLPNFNIRIKHIEQEAFTTNAYIDMSDAEVVFTADAYQMPTVTGWHTWEIEPFAYDGQSNLVVEITWGLLPNWTSTYYKVATTNQSANLVAYGYSDTNPLPAINGTTANRPNLWLAFAADDPADEQLITFVINNQMGEILEGAQIAVGSLSQLTNAEGQTEFTLMTSPDFYRYTATAENHRPIIGQQFNVEEEAKTIEVTLDRVFNLAFSVIDEWDNVLTNATIQVGDQTFEAGKYLVDDLLPGTYDIVVEHEYYFPYEGTVEIVDIDQEVQITLYADGTGVEESLAGQTRVYPNPARDQFTLELPADKTADVYLVNTLGQTLESFNDLSGSTNISTRSLKTGYYFIRIVDQDGIIVKKLSIVE
ncbi:MAG: C25 family cysteine peptidase [Bacteroides sp.]|nr:C25 family cysteine peptidase [Bacteroides sp.]